MRSIFAAAFLLLLAGPAWAGDLPNPSLTPGVTRDLTVQQVCSTRWGKDARAVTAAMKRQVMEAYHMTASDCPSGKVEIDHLVSRELSGADDTRNLWPECYERPGPGKTPSEVAEWGAHKKDRIENRLHVEVCAGRLSLGEAQRMISTDWIAAYKRYFGEPSAPTVATSRR